MDFGSMSDGELRRLHAMFLANPQSFANNPAYMHALIQENARRFSPGNVENNLDAAATEIIPDPLAGQKLGPDYRRSRADAAVDSVTGGHLYTPSENVDAMDVATPPTRRALDAAMSPTPDGLPRGYAEWAAGMAVASGDKPLAERLKEADAFDARVDRMAEDYNRATGLPQPSGLAADDGYRDWSGWTPGNRLPPGRSDTQRMLDARAQAEAERDARLQPMLDADRKDNAARQAWLENPENEAAARDVSGVKARERADDYRRERMMYRHAQQTGIPIEQIRAENPSFASVGSVRDGSMPTLVKTKDGMQVRDVPITTSTMRDQAARARIDAAKKREDAWRSQMMLAGNNPRKNAVNAWNALGDQSLNDWQRLTMAKALRPDIDGTSPLTVEANSARNAMRLINADMVGQGGLGDTRAQMMQQKARADAAAYADSQWAQKPTRSRTTAARERLMRDIENRYGPGTGIVAAELEVIDTPAQQATGAQSTNPTHVGPSPNPLNPSVPLAVPSRPPGV